MKAWIYIPILLVSSIFYSRMFSGSSSEISLSKSVVKANRFPASAEESKGTSLMKKIKGFTKL